MALYLKIKIALFGLKKITFNYLIISIEKLMNISCIKVMQTITIYKYDDFSNFKNIIKSRLEELFD